MLNEFLQQLLKQRGIWRMIFSQVNCWKRTSL